MPSPRRRVARRLPLISVLASISIAVTACSGSSTGTHSDTPIVSESAGASSAAPNAFGEQPGKVDGAAVASRVRTALSDWSSVRVSSADATEHHATMASVEVSYSPTDTAFRYVTPGRGFDETGTSATGSSPRAVTIADLGDPLTMRQVDGDYFLAANPAHLSKPWLRFPAGSDDAWAVLVRQNMSATVRNLDPYVIATMLSAGDEVYLRTTPTMSSMHYQAVLRGASMLKVMSDADAERLMDSVSALTEIAEITLDAQNRPSELTIKVSGTTVTQSQTFSAWDGPVDIPVPAADQVVDSTELEGLGFTP